MNKFVFILIVFVLGCSDNASLEFTNITISYAHNLTIQEGDWIEIDGNKIFHVSSMQELNSKTMPVSNVIVDRMENKEWKSKVNYIGMGLNLARVVENLNNNDVTYIVEKDFDLKMLGKVKITRSDGNPISISFSKDYPVSVSEGL